MSESRPSEYSIEKAAERSEHAAWWLLDPAVRFLNHGSFGACPRPVLAAQTAWRDRLERQPLRFLLRELEELLADARVALGELVGAHPDDLAWIPNTTTGVNTALRALGPALGLRAGDEILVTDHEYNASRNALEAVARDTGAVVRVVTLPFPLAHEDELIERVLAAVTPRTHALLIDHITSQTAMVVPIQRLIEVLRPRGVEVVVDGAHGPGMLPLWLEQLGAAYYIGNLHKWVCAPKGAAFMHVRRDLQPYTWPLVVSHGANSPRTDKSRFRLLFDWMGTGDPTPFLAVPVAIRFLEDLVPGGLTAVQERNRAMCLEARRLICRALDVAPPVPDSMIGSMAVIPLPDGNPAALRPPLYLDPLQDALLTKHRIEIPVTLWPRPPKRLIRISVHMYNDLPEYQALAAALQEELALEASQPPPPTEPTSP